MIPVVAYLGAALALVAAGAWGGHELTAMRYQSKIDAAARAAAAEVAAANQQAANVADDYAVWASLQRPKTITVTREVEREVKLDTDCSARPLPDGLRNALAAAASADADQPVADRAVPAASAPYAFDLGGLGARLRGRFGGTAGVPGEAQGTQ